MSGCSDTRCSDCSYNMCPRHPDTVLQESAAGSCLPSNVIQVEFRSDEKRIADLEKRVAEVEEALLDMARLQRRMAKQQELVLDAFIKLIT